MKKNKKQIFSSKIIKRFLNEKEYKEFQDAYEKNKVRQGKKSVLVFSRKDKKLFKKHKLDLNGWKKRWNFKSTNGTLIRLGKLYFFSK